MAISNSPISKHNGQKKVWLDPSRYKIVVCGRRWGKTILGAEAILKASDVPKSYNVYIGPTRQQAKEIVWDYLKERCCQLGWRVKINESELYIKRVNRSVIEVKSAEREERFRGRKFNLVVLDEFSEYKSPTIWTQSIRPTLSDEHGSAIFLFTPKGYGFSYDLYQSSKTQPGWNNFHFKTIDSPFFQTAVGRAEIQDAKNNLSERDFRQEYEASFESHSGRVYESFDRKINNTYHEFSPSYGPIIVGQDFNRSPMCSALFQRKDGQLHQFGEVFLRTGNTTETCKEIARRYKNIPIIFRPDATGRNRSTNSSTTDFDIIKSFGFSIESGTINPRRVDRWAAVNSAYEKLKVMVNVALCPRTVKDRESLVYKEGTGEPDLRDKMAGHMADAADYAIVREFPLFKAPKVNVSNWM